MKTVFPLVGVVLAGTLSTTSLANPSSQPPLSAMVLSLKDVPAGFAVQRHGPMVAENGDFRWLRGPGWRAGWYSTFIKGYKWSSPGIESDIKRYNSAWNAHRAMLASQKDSKRGQRPVRTFRLGVALGDEARAWGNKRTTRISWRYGIYECDIYGWTIGKQTAIRLALKQQAKVEAVYVH